MNIKTITYWICTGLVTAMATMAAVMVFSGNPQVAAGTAHLGYPPYFPYILAVWEVLGVVALLAPGFGLVKEWAYAGFLITYTSAFVSHLGSGDGVGKAAVPMVALLILAGSYVLRPASRRVAAAPVL